jgi:type IV secretory pathway VirB10-like protein
MKEMTNVASAVMTEEEKAELDKEMKGQNAGISTPTVEHEPIPVVPTAAPATATETPSSPKVHSEPIPADAGHPVEDHVPAQPPPSSPSSKPSPGLHVSPLPSPGPSPSTSPAPNDTASTKEREEARKKKGKQKLTPEQRQKLDELEKERKKAMEERVKVLTDKLIERVRPFVDAERPGDPSDSETQAFQKKIQLEAEDLKFESFGVEVRLLAS